MLLQQCVYQQKLSPRGKVPWETSTVISELGVEKFAIEIECRQHD